MSTEHKSPIWTTIVENKLGHIQLWLGIVEPKNKHEFIYTVDGDAGEYFQMAESIRNICLTLNGEELSNIRAGYPIATTNIPADYIPEHRWPKAKASESYEEYTEFLAKHRFTTDKLSYEKYLKVKKILDE